MNLNIIQPTNLIVDCDEVLCNISPLWTKRLIENKDKLESYFDFSIVENLYDDAFVTKVLSRPNFYLNQWLKKKDVNLSEEEMKEVMDTFYNVYDEKDFYLYMKPTNMCKTLAKVAYTTMVEKIYVVTRCSENNLDNKIEFIKNNLPESKLEIRVVKEGNKSDYVRDIKMENGLVFEDELKNINDYLDNCDNIHDLNFYVPLLGYNAPDQNLYEKCDAKKIGLIYYPQDMKEGL